MRLRNLQPESKTVQRKHCLYAAPRFLLGAALALVLTLPGEASANPDIKDGAIRVLVNFKSSCNQQSMTREDTGDSGLKFTIECADKTFYPDGLVVLCPERDVEMSCRIVTQPREFKFLNLIYGPMGERVGGFEDDENEQ